MLLRWFGIQSRRVVLHGQNPFPFEISRQPVGQRKQQQSQDHSQSFHVLNISLVLQLTNQHRTYYDVGLWPTKTLLCNVACHTGGQVSRRGCAPKRTLRNTRLVIKNRYQQAGRFVGLRSLGAGGSKRPGNWEQLAPPALFCFTPRRSEPSIFSFDLITLMSYRLRQCPKTPK